LVATTKKIVPIVIGPKPQHRNSINLDLAVSKDKKGALAMERQRRERMYRRAKNLLR
jgi:hypothetical protein